jgi:DNA helicase IV
MTDIEPPAATWPVQDEMTGEVVSDPDGFPIAELEAQDYLELTNAVSLEERAAGERAWRFGHVIVDEAQDLTPMQWRMVTRRARGHSMTIVGDVAQRSVGKPGAWSEILPPELGDVPRFDLSTNYRSPEEVGDLAARVLAALAPDLDAPKAIRSSGHPVEFVKLDAPASIHDHVDATLASFDDGRLAVVGPEAAIASLTPEHPHGRVSWLSARAAKGMEFDSVIVFEPQQILDEENGLSLLYVALTRTTDRLTVAHSTALPDVLVTDSRRSEGQS